MFRIIILTALVTLTVANPFWKCADEPPPTAIRIPGCDDTRCPSIIGENLIIEVDFAPAHRVNAMTAKVVSKSFGISIELYVPKERRNVCKNLMRGAYCPLDADKHFTVKLSLSVDPYYPETTFLLEISLVDDANKVVACFMIEIIVERN